MPRKKKAKPSKPAARKPHTQKPTAPADPVIEYCEDVIAGRIVAGRLVVMACQRHLADLDRKDIYWDLAAALYAIEFFETVLCLNGGEFEGKPFLLVPWQKFIIGSLFGWKQSAGGPRRFNWVYCEIGKGNGKSPLAGGVGLYMMVADKEPRAEIYSAAFDKEQAKVLFRDAVAMRDQSPRLAELLTTSGTGENVWNLAYHKTGSWFRPWSRERRGKSGFRPHCALVDELHEHPDSTIFEMLRLGEKGRRQPLIFSITNSGYDRQSVCYQHHELAIKVLKGTLANDRLFAYVCTLDPCEDHVAGGFDQPVDECKSCDDFHDEKVWPKANPNLDISIRHDYLRDRVREADQMPATRNTVLRLNFCLWTNAASRYLPADHWKACGGAIEYDRLRGRPCYGGLDLSRTVDLAAFCLLFPPDNVPMREIKHKNPDGTPLKNPDGTDVVTWELSVEEMADADEFVVLPFFWLPKDNLDAAAKRDQVPYDVWARAHLIEPTPGNVVDYRAIRAKIIALKDVYSIQAIGYDPYNATETALDLQDAHGLKMMEVRQGFPSLNEPTKTLLRLVMKHKIRHGGNPILTWMADNMVVAHDRNQNVMPDKEKSTQKIDGISALVDALAVAIKNPRPRRSVYEDRGVRSI